MQVPKRLRRLAALGFRPLGVVGNAVAKTPEQRHRGGGAHLQVRIQEQVGKHRPRRHRPATSKRYCQLPALGHRPLGEHPETWGHRQVATPQRQRLRQRVRSSDPEVKARLHEGPGGKYLWVLNPTREAHEVTIQLTSRDAASRITKDLWQGKQVTADGNTVKVTVEDRDVAVIQLQ